MKLYRIIACALLAACLMCAGSGGATQANAPDITAKAAILVDSTTGTVLYEKDADVHLPIASVTKIMTLNIIFENIESGNLALDDIVTVSEKAAKTGGSHVFTDANGKYKASELIKSIIIASANDACVAMSEHIAGSEEGFVAIMNEHAKQWGMQNTHFADCTGMPCANHYSSARDVAVMSRKLVQHELFFNWSSIWMDEIEHKGGRVTGLTNTNRLVRFFEGCDGIKTGYTSEAGFCLSATLKKGDMRLISVIIGGKTSQDRFDEARELINYGFGNFALHTMQSEDAVIPLKNGLEKQAIVHTKECAVVLPKGVKTEKTVQLPQNLTAPVAKGEKVGEVIYTVDGVRVASADIVAARAYEKATLGGIIKKLLGIEDKEQ